MVAASLPEEGELRVGPVSLPAGKRVHAGFEAAIPVAWVTHDEVPEAGRVWGALSDASPGTGLVPFLLGGLPIDPAQVWQDEDLDAGLFDSRDVSASARPWDTEEFSDPADPSEADGMDAASVLQRLWDGETHEADDGEEEDPEFLAHIQSAVAPFSREFPGLAPAGAAQLSPQELGEVLGSLPAARIGLVPAGRPADVLPLIGWTPSDQSDALPVAAVLRSWEDRFGAKLLQVGFAWVSVLVSRPPRSIEHAQRIAAEHFAFCDECAGLGLREISPIASSLMESPIWSFWWD